MAVVLYKRQREILEFINKFIIKNGYSPTLSEIGGALGMSSPATVHEHIKALQKKGVIRKLDGQVRGLEVVQMAEGENLGLDPSTAIELPLLGYIHAGKPLEPYDDPNATFKVSPNLVPPNKKAYVLRVKGDSMIDDGIFEGDYVVLVKTDDVRNGDTVVALLESGLATLKRYYVDEKGIKLVPANSKMEPIIVPSVEVQGKLAALVRKYN